LMQLRMGKDVDRKTLLENLSLNSDEIEERLIEEELKPQMLAQQMVEAQSEPVPEMPIA